MIGGDCGAGGPYELLMEYDMDGAVFFLPFPYEFPLDDAA